MSRAGETIPDWQLERFRLKELPPDEQARVGALVEGSPALRERLAGLDRSDEQILAAHPPRRMAESVRARGERGPEAEPPRGGRRLVLAVAAGVVLVGLWALRPAADRPSSGGAGNDSTRMKGRGPHLVLYRQAAPEPEQLGDGATVRTRDVIQVLYVAAGARYGVVASVDGRGGVTVHLPAGGDRAAELDANGPVILASAWELDDAPAFERFFFVTSATPFRVETVSQAVRRLAADGADPARLDLPSSLGQSTFLLRKDGSR